MRDFEEKYKGKDLRSLVVSMVNIREDLDIAKDIKTALQKEYDFLRNNIIPQQAEREEIDTCDYTDVGKLIILADSHVSILASNRAEAFDWLRNNGYEDIVIETVNASTLKALITDITKGGGEMPPDNLIQFKPFTKASVRKLATKR